MRICQVKKCRVETPETATRRQENKDYIWRRANCMGCNPVERPLLKRSSTQERTQVLWESPVPSLLCWWKLGWVSRCHPVLAVWLNWITPGGSQVSEMCQGTRKHRCIRGRLHCRDGLGTHFCQCLVICSNKGPLFQLYSICVTQFTLISMAGLLQIWSEIYFRLFWYIFSLASINSTFPLSRVLRLVPI